MIEEVGRVVQVVPAGGGLALVVEAPVIGPECESGDSVAVNGVCLTVEEMTGGNVKFHVSTETVQRSTVAGWRPGMRVNLERALAAGQRMGGHFVQGHVDCTSQLIRRTPPAETVYFTFSLPGELRPFVAEKGSVAVDGISLTVTEATEAGFAVAIIPYTLANTNLGKLAVGASVNVEVDVIAKYVYNILNQSSDAAGERITADFLAEHGFC